MQVGEYLCFHFLKEKSFCASKPRYTHVFLFLFLLIDLPWIVGAHPFDGSAHVQPTNAGKDFGQDAVFWTQQALMFPGKYAFQIDIDGILSDIVSVETSPHVSILQIIKQPKTTRFYDQPASPGDLFEQQPIVAAYGYVYHSDGTQSRVPSGGVKISTMFVNDDMTAAPALSDLIEQPMGNSKDIDKPFLGRVGSSSLSTPSSMTNGHAQFTSVSFVSGRTGKRFFVSTFFIFLNFNDTYFYILIFFRLLSYGVLRW